MSPAEEHAAATLFASRRGLAERYADLLTGPGVTLGLLGPREAGRLWPRHLLNCAAVATLLPTGASVLDIGSGAGLPGIPLVLARPDLRLTLLEPMQRRVDFLIRCVRELDLPVMVTRGRAEQMAGQIRTSHAVARAVAPLERLAGWARPLLAPAGELLAIKGRQARPELDRARPTLAVLGLAGDVVSCGGDILAEPTVVVRLRRSARARVARTAPGGS